MTSSTIADRCIADWAGQRGGFDKHAKAHGATDRDVIDGMAFYFFPDGSRVGTKGRGNHHQLWALTPPDGSTEP